MSDHPYWSKSPDEGRRAFLKASGTALAGTMFSGWMPVTAATPSSAKEGAYPVINVAPLDAIRVNTPLAFTYPDERSPAILVRLHEAAPGGVGPGSSIVAFSSLCTHKGCPLGYRPERKLLICPCHWSSFDPAKAGQIVIGQASQSLPQIVLQVRSGMVQAIGINGLIYGRHTNIL